MKLLYLNYEDDPALSVQDDNGHTVAGFVYNHGEWKDVHPAEFCTKGYLCEPPRWGFRHTEPPTSPDGITPLHTEPTTFRPAI
jgi:hypothetical protein